jgi:PadR family transcriptional regulator, regulatory protein PadR
MKVRAAGPPDRSRSWADTATSSAPAPSNSILHGLEKKGLLVSTEKRVGSATRRVYRTTPAGAQALAAAKLKVRELFGELFEDE